MLRRHPLQLLRIVFAAATLILCGCATSNPSAIKIAHLQFVSGNTDAAVKTLAKADSVADKDRLLYWLEKGMYLHYAGNYSDSNKELLQAASYLDRSNFISVRDEGRELLANEWVSRYRGEYSERLWIHSVLMMNFLQLGQFEGAAVEARRALEVIDSQSDLLAHDHFTRALIALSLESAGQTNDAYIVNRKLANSIEKPVLNSLLLEQASTLRFMTDLQELSKITEIAPPESQQTVVVFVANGRIPQKFSGSILADDTSRLAFPQYFINAEQPQPVQVYLNNQRCKYCIDISSDFGRLVNQSLQKRAVALTTKSFIRAVAKEAVAEAVEDKDELLGQITRLLLFALEEADTRSWMSLPRHFSLIRIPIPATSTANEIELRTANGTSKVIKLDSPTRRFQFVSLSDINLGNAAY